MRVAVALAAVLVLSACGGTTVTTNATTTVPLPVFPAAVAERLATESDAVAADLDRGDDCAAAADAARLRTDAIAAINDHRIPGPYQETLLGRVQALEAQITCTPPAPVSHDKGKHKGEKKHRHGDGGG
jgi:hypothetical protein